MIFILRSSKQKQGHCREIVIRWRTTTGGNVYVCNHIKINCKLNSKLNWLPYAREQYRGFNNFGDKRLFEVEQTAVIEKGP